MPSKLQVIIGSVILVIAIFSGVVVEFEFGKDHTSIKRDGVILAKEKWVVSAERSYINLNSWYRRNVMCPRIIEDGGHISPSGTRCYYPNDYYEQLSRSLIKTKIEVEDTTVIKTVPHYAYGSRGSYAGYLVETMEFTETNKIEEFPEKYNINWKPKDTRNYKLVWRVNDIKDLHLEDGIYNGCKYQFGNLKIDLGKECNKLNKAVVKGNDMWFYFNAEKGEQNFNLGFVDPTETFYIRTGNATSDAFGEVTVSFMNMPNNSYSALANSLTDDDTVYSFGWNNKVVGGTDWKLEDDLGGNEAANFMYGAILHQTINYSGYQMECGSEIDIFTSAASVYFTNNFTNTNYSAICNPSLDDDTPICIQDDVTGKDIDAVFFRLNDDGGGAESVNSVDWCVFQWGEYDFGEVTIKAGQDTQASANAEAIFITPFPDTNYVVFTTDATSFDGDGCSCEITDRRVDGFNMTCADDAASTTACNSDSFDWVAIEQGDFNSSLEESSDSCTAPASPANWAVDINDNCTTNAEVNITGYNISYYCTGVCDGSHTINTTIYVDEILNGSLGMMINGTSNGKICGGEK